MAVDRQPVREKAEQKISGLEILLGMPDNKGRFYLGGYQPAPTSESGQSIVIAYDILPELAAVRRRILLSSCVHLRLRHAPI
jgi:hypothetical protein